MCTTGRKQIAVRATVFVKQLRVRCKVVKLRVQCIEQITVYKGTTKVLALEAS